jgi:hypothetical protein
MKPFRYGLAYALAVGGLVTIAMIAAVVIFTGMA